jgi:aryl-alcohol dehydrogenase-like predicted oxidoreductase
MKQTYLGRTGLVVSELCLGCMTFGETADMNATRAIVERFRAAGGTFFDTADVYAEGRSEEILGGLLRADRDQVVIATKAFGRVGEGPNDVSSSRRHLVRAVEASLRRLRTDWIDLYQLHRWDETTPLDETLATLEDLVRAGKVLYVGVSNWVGWQIERAVRLQEAAGYDRFVSLQPQYSLIERKIELETLPAVYADGLGVLAWSPLAAGFLTGKYARGERGEGKGRFAQWIDHLTDRDWDVLDTVREIAKDHDVEPATVAIAWVLSKPSMIPIVGATRPEQLEATLAAAELTLDADAVTRLDEVGAPVDGYPWDVNRWPLVGRPSRQTR